MKEKKNTSRWFILLLLLLPKFTGALSAAVMPPLFIEIIEQIHLTKGQMGLNMGAIGLAALVFSPIGGMLTDRMGSRRVVGIGVFIAAVSTGLRSYVDSPLGLFVCMLGLGIGLSILIPSIPKVLGLWFSSKELAFANGLAMAGPSLANVIGTATAASILSPFFGGWRVTMLAIGIFFLAIGVIWVLFYRDPQIEGSVEEEKGNMLLNLKMLSRLEEARTLMLLSGMQMFGYFSIATFLPICLQERGVAHAGELTAIVWATAIVFNILGGKISDRVKRRKQIIFYGFIFAGVGTPFLANMTGSPLILFLVLTGAGLGTVPPILLTLPLEMDKVGTKHAGTVIGFMVMFGSAGGILGSFLTGKLIDMTGSYLVGFGCAGVVFIAAALFLISIKETAKGRHLISNRKCRS